LRAAPLDVRRDALRRALSKAEDAERDGLRLVSFSKIRECDLRRGPVVMRLKALLVQVFARSIANNHSPEDAAELLFAPQQFGTGSGELLDYIGDLPGRRLSKTARGGSRA
jgi:hypothetical protein